MIENFYVLDIPGYIRCQQKSMQEFEVIFIEFKVKDGKSNEKNWWLQFHFRRKIFTDNYFSLHNLRKLKKKVVNKLNYLFLFYCNENNFCYLLHISEEKYVPICYFIKIWKGVIENQKRIHWIYLFWFYWQMSNSRYINLIKNLRITRMYKFSSSMLYKMFFCTIFISS